MRSTQRNSKRHLTEQVGVRLSPDKYAKLTEIAAQDKRRIAELARIVIEEYIEKRTAA